MAISWGSWVTNGSGNGMRVGAEFTQSPNSVGSGTSSVTVTVRRGFRWLVVEDGNERD